MSRSELLVAGRPTLVLVPTERELTGIAGAAGWRTGLGLLELAGFGPVAAAARTAELLARLTPGRVLLLGIAGSFDLAELPIGSACAFDSAQVDGIGAGAGRSRIGPRELGWAQWPGSASAEREPVWDALAWRSGDSASRRLLTVCSASASLEEAADRKRTFPLARAEDMEGFGVAIACSMQAVPLRIVRGIANAAGDRAGLRGRIDEALAAASELARELLECEEEWSVPRPEAGA